MQKTSRDNNQLINYDGQGEESCLNMVVRAMGRTVKSFLGKLKRSG